MEPQIQMDTSLVQVTKITIMRQVVAPTHAKEPGGITSVRGQI